MKLLYGVLIFIVCDKVAADVKSDFRKTKLVPDILNEGPSQLLQVTYNYRNSDKSVQFGKELKPTVVANSPVVEWHFDPSNYYTLIMSDIDPISREKPTYREFLQWMVTNIPGDDFSKGETIVEYAGVGPPLGYGFHRIVFTVYKQPDQLVFDEHHTPNRMIGIRFKFLQRDFSNKYHLGNPIAGNMFIAQYDSYVPILYEEFKNGYKYE